MKETSPSEPAPQRDSWIRRVKRLLNRVCTAPSKDAETQPFELSAEDAKRLPSSDALKEALSRGVWPTLTLLFKPGLRLVTLVALRRFYGVLSQFNNLLLPPLFTMLSLEVYHGLTHGETIMTRDHEDLDYFFSVFFFAEWFLGWCLAKKKWVYFFNIWLILDLAATLPMVLGQFLRTARFIRIMRLLKFTKVAKMRKLNFQFGRLITALGVAASAILAGAIALRGVEPQTVPAIDDSLWWSLVTLSTVGYGDISPTTLQGRIVAGVMIVFGLGVFSYMTGLVASTVRDVEEEQIIQDMEHVKRELVTLHSKLDGIERLLKERRSSEDEGSP